MNQITHSFPSGTANTEMLGGGEYIPSNVNPAHGGRLTNSIVGPERRVELQAASRDWPSWELSERQLCDLELLLNGGFSPLQSFLGRADWESVCSSMRLANGLIWPIPVTLDVPEVVVRKLGANSTLALRDPEGVLLAALHVTEAWQPDRISEAEVVYGSTSTEHPGVAYLLQKTHPWYVGGQIEGIQPPTHYDFTAIRHTPAEMRAEFSRLGWNKVVAFQTRNPMHRAHFELTLRAMSDVRAKLLIHPVVGLTKPGDVDYFTRVRCYQHLLAHYPKATVKLALLPLAMRMAGPREAVWHAIIRKNYGCTHLIVGRDHAGPGKDSTGKSFYDPYAAQELLVQHEAELGVSMVPFRMMVYLEEQTRYVPEDEVVNGKRVLNISGSDLRRRLHEGESIPRWFTFPEIARELQRTYLPRHKQGFTVFFTGLSGAGKSTLANALLIKLQETGGRPVTLLDGDIVRKHLSSELGFSKEHRDINIRRIGFVSAEITKNGGIAICAPIAPYESIRKEVREMVEPGGGFVLVHVATPLAVCEQRDRKGLYAKARAGILTQFTGISDPYETPTDADLTIDTSSTTPEESTLTILRYLARKGFLDSLQGCPGSPATEDAPSNA
jgi:sulfate adenylyltransferase